MSDPIHLDRLLLVWHLALWWLYALGRQVIKRGLRPWFERRDQRQRSVIRLGRLGLLHWQEQERTIPLLFRPTPTGWVARGPA